MKKVWNVLRDCRKLSNDEIIDKIFEDRKIEDINSFLRPNKSDLIPFEKMKNIDQTSKVILDGINENKKFYVLEDVDGDGTCAGAIAVRWLKHMGADVKVGINEGKKHGIHGFDLSLLDGIDIMWIVDSIETSIEPYKIITDLGIKICITDHHIISKELQDEMKENGNIFLVSSAVDYPNEHLCGAATTWKLVSYMCWLELDDYDEQLIDLAAVGTITDMVDISLEHPENRYICYQGFNNQVNPGIKKVNGSYEFNANSCAFGLGPLVNAANRTNNNEKAMALFLSDDTKEINSIIKELKKCKETQNSEIMDLLPDLDKQANSQLDKKVMYFFVDTENDVKGLLANKLIEKYMRPVLVLSNYIEVDNETGEVLKHEYRGSMRAIGVDNFKRYIDCIALGWVAGHENAAGVGIPVKDFKQFQEFLEDMLADVEFVQETEVDVQLDAEQINDQLIRQLKSINKISGSGFKPISVMIDGIVDYTVGYMSGGKHLRIDTPYLTLIKWNCSDEVELGQEISAIGTLDLSFFGRKLTKQLIMSDFKVEETL